MTHDELSFPALNAVTQRFSLGVPTSVRVTADGSRVLFLRSRSGTDRESLLWCRDGEPGAERVLLDPQHVLHGDAERVPAEELARRERLRQGGLGVAAFSLDGQGAQAVVALSGQVVLVAVEDGDWRQLGGRHHAVDPHLSPDGRWVAYHADRGLHLLPTDTFGGARTLAHEADPSVTWGLADFVHAEELARARAFWWAPDSSGLLVTRVDESPVDLWHISDPAHPSASARPVRYPAAGTANPETTLWWVTLDGTRHEVTWDRATSPYLVSVAWTEGSPALLAVLDRHQREMTVLTWSPGEQAQPRRTWQDDCWVDVVPGVPAWWGDRLLTVEVDAHSDSYRLCADGEPLSPVGQQVRAVLAVEPSAVLLSIAEDDGERRVARLTSTGELTVLTPADAVATGWAAAGTTVLRVDASDTCRPQIEVHTGSASGALEVLALDPPWTPRPRLLPRQGDDPRVGVLEPSVAPAGPLPVLLDPYGGPHASSVLASARAWAEGQWWADQGYLVVIADGPGTPGSPRWERAMAGAFTGPALSAQVRALEMVAETYGERADLGRVGIRGWSFGGYLAALAVLDRPDVVHAAVAGAPVTDWNLYDTAYTERYLGLPHEHPGRYDSESLLARAPALQRPLLLIHGFSDDNVVVAHTLRLSQALLEAGRPHEVLPLSGVTHMTPQAVVAENLLMLQRDFLARALAQPEGRLPRRQAVPAAMGQKGGGSGSSGGSERDPMSAGSAGGR